VCKFRKLLFISLATIEIRAKNIMKGKVLLSNKYVLALSAAGTTVAGAFFLKWVFGVQSQMRPAQIIDFLCL
jgi:hypothetical protein